MKSIFRKPARVYVEGDERNMQSLTRYHTTLYSVLPTGPGDAYYWEDSATTARSDQHWNDGGDAGGSSSNGTVFVKSSGEGSTNFCTEQMSWPADLWPWLQDGTGTLAGDCGFGSREIDPAPVAGRYFAGATGAHCEVSDPKGPRITLQYMTHVNNSPDWQEDEHDKTYVRHAQTRLKLATGGRAVPGARSLIKLTGGALEVLHPRALPPSYDNWAVRAIPKGVSPEWPLVKAPIIAGSAFPVTAAVGDFHEFAARLVEQGKGLGTAFDGAGFRPVGSQGH